MPILELKQKIEFNVDQMTIDRVEALATIDGLSLDAWFRRLVDEMAGLGTRQMKHDHALFALRPAVAAIIENLASKISPLQAKAQQCLARIKAVVVKVEVPPAAGTSEPVKKKKRGIRLARLLNAEEEEAEEEVEEADNHE